MDFFYSPYSVTPLRSQDANGDLGPGHGTYLRAINQTEVTYANYFPKPLAGHKGFEQFLEEFKNQQQSAYNRKIIHLLLRDKDYQLIPQTKFFNHQLWTGSEDLRSRVIKYKLKRYDDKAFLDPLKRGIRVRLDATGIFDRKTFGSFVSSIPHELRSLIDYVEDPLSENDWSDLGLNLASDIIRGFPYDVKIHRPNCEFFPPQEKKVIFSSYFGGDLGRWHSYCELIEYGNLQEFHGIISSGFIKEEKTFLVGNYLEGFTPDIDAVKSIYSELEKREWRFFCSF